MAEQGEKWVKEILQKQGFVISQEATEDCLAIIGNMALIIEEKDNKYPIKIAKTRVYTVAGRKTFKFNFKQMNKHTQRILNKFRNYGKFFNIVQVYVVSRMIGENSYVNVVRNYNTNIFFVDKSYFPVWLKYFKFVYLGCGGLEKVDYYMGGK